VGAPLNLQALLAARRGNAGSPVPMAGAAGPAGTAPNAAAQQVQQSISSLQELNPQQMQKQVDDWYKGVVEMIPRLAFRVPNAASSLTQAMKGLQGAQKAIKELVSTMEAVGGPSGPPPSMAQGPLNIGAGAARIPQSQPSIPGGAPVA